MNEPVAVGEVEGIRHLSQDGEHFRRRKFHPPQGRALHQLHGDVGQVRLGIAIQHPADVGMLGPGLQPGLLNHAGNGRGAPMVQELERHPPVKEGVPGFEHLAHPPLSQAGAQEVTPDPAPW